MSPTTTAWPAARATTTGRAWSARSRQAGYDNALTVEFVAPLDRTPANPYKNALGTADARLTPEQLKFIQDHGSGVLSDEFYSWLVEVSAKTLRNAHEADAGRGRSDSIRMQLRIVEALHEPTPDRLTIYN